MGENHDTESGSAEKSERLAHWFFPTVGLIYGCGFLIAFTFFNSFGISSIDFIEAKYIHVGVLFCFACLAVAVPLWWFVWSFRSISPKAIAAKIQDGLLKTTGKERRKYFIYGRIRKFFFPDWSVDEAHGINAGPAVRISMILILWSFIIIVMFASSTFGRVHPKLAIFNFLTPMCVLLLGIFADLFKGGEFSKSQHSNLAWIRYGLRVWWLIGGGFYLCAYLLRDYLAYEIMPLGVGFFSIPLFAIAVRFWAVFCFPRRRNAVEDMLTRVCICQWAIYAIQWAAVVFQIWIFIWTIKRETLGISLWNILFGDDYVPELKRQIGFGELWMEISNSELPKIPFPHGGIYFVFIIILIGLFIFRNSYRLQQIEETRDKAHKMVTTISMAVIIVPLGYISILTFAHTLYPYIPYEKGGGDYTGCPPVHLAFNYEPAEKNGLLISIPPKLLSENASNCLIILDENADFVYLAATNDTVGGPVSWRNGSSKPKVYEVRRDAIDCISSLR